jgi:hypothetical protein
MLRETRQLYFNLNVKIIFDPWHYPEKVGVKNAPSDRGIFVLG